MDFLQSKTQRNISFPILVFSNFGPFFTRRLLFFRFAENYSQGFYELRRGCQKTGKNQGFFGCPCLFFSTISSPHGHLSSSYTLLLANVSFILAFLLLLLCFSLQWLCCLVSIHLYLYCVFIFHSVLCLCCILSWSDKNPDQITKFLKCCFSWSASVPASHHFHLAQIIALFGPEKNPSKWYICCLVCCS